MSNTLLPYSWLSIAEHMPTLSGDPERDAAWTADAQVQAYLDFYRINFARELGVRHGMGALALAGYRIASHYWLPANARGTLVVVHGYYDHVGIFDKALRFGLDNQLAVVAFDLPGHGLSSGERSAIGSFDEYGDVLAGVLDALAPQLPGPRYCLGQSTGAAVLLNHLWRYPQQAREWHKIALCSPLLVPRAWWTLGRFTYALLSPFCQRLKRSRSRSSHDPAFIELVDERDPLQDKTLSVRWVGAMKAWDAQFKTFAPKDVPLLVVQGTGDMTVAWRYNIPQLQRKLPQLQLHYIADAGHQLVNEIDEYRLPLFARIRAYFFAQ